MFCDDNNIYIDVYINTLNVCINYGLFNKDIYNKYHILTSKRIQNNYFVATERRKSVDMLSLLLCIDVNINPLNVNINPLNVNINRIDVPCGTQRKEDKRKELNTTSKKIDVDINKFDVDTIEFKLSLYLKTLIIKNNPNAKTPVNLLSWSKTVDLMIRIDKRSSDQIKKIIKKSQTHSFWKTNILSMEALRAQFDKVTMANNTNPNFNNKSHESAFEERTYTEEEQLQYLLDPLNVIEKDAK